MKIRKVGRPGFLVVLMLLLLVAATAWAETLYVQRPKVEVKEGRGAFFATIFEAKEGDALEVVSQESGWYQVKTPKGNGWVYGEALGAKKDSGFSLANLLGSSDTSELDKTAGFKGFDKATEQEYVAQNKLGPQLKIVDQIQKVPFSVQEFRKFQKDGQLPVEGGGQ